MDRKTLLAVVLCFLIFMGWQKLYIEPRMPHTAPVATTPTTNSAPQVQSTSTPVATAGTATTSKEVPVQIQGIPTSIGEAQISNGSTIFESWTIKAYKKGLAADTSSVDLNSVTNTQGDVSLAFDDKEYAYLEGRRGELTRSGGGVSYVYDDEKIHLTREITGGADKPYLDVKLTATFKGPVPKFAFVSTNIQGSKDDPESHDRALMVFANESLEKKTMSETVETKHVPFDTKFVAASSRYFLISLVPQGDLAPKGLIQGTGPYAGRVSLAYPVSGNSITIPMRVYFGPKELELLRSVDPRLDHTVDFGMFVIIAYPLLKILKWFYAVVKNYGVAIILLTLLLKLVTYPLTYKSMKSMREMAKIQPQLQKLKEKHKDDKEALNREMMTLMRSHGYNPLAGCLPMVIQMPVFFALYRVLYSSIELYQAPFALWIHDLSARDPIYVTPVLLTVTMWLQQRLQPNTATDPAQTRMMQMMPLIFGIFMVTVPSGLTLYMLVNAIASIFQQMILNKKLGMPNAPVARAAK